MANQSNNNQESNSEFDIFIANSIFPDPHCIFKSNLKTLQEIKDNALIVLDTNALLVPYNIGKESFTQIEATYTQLFKKKQLLIPGQVAREFAKNRTSKILQAFQQLSRKANNIQPLKKEYYPLLESIDDYQELIKLEDEINESIKKYRKKSSHILNHIRSWTWNDPVSSLYSECFTEETIFDLKFDKEEVKKELLRRQLHKIPPGYKDSAKDDSGIGDLLVWLTILDVAKQNDIIFVSDDQKPDWWYRIENEALYPRYELIDEFRQVSNGQTLHIITFSEFLKLYGVSEEIIEEVREEETRQKTNYELVGNFLAKWNEIEEILMLLYQRAYPENFALRSTMQMADLLKEADLIGSNTYYRLKRLSEFRNQLVHPTTITHSVDDMIVYIVEAKEVIDIISPN